MTSQITISANDFQRIAVTTAGQAISTDSAFALTFARACADGQIKLAVGNDVENPVDLSQAGRKGPGVKRSATRDSDASRIISEKLAAAAEEVVPDLAGNTGKAVGAAMRFLGSECFLKAEARAIENLDDSGNKALRAAWKDGRISAGQPAYVHGSFTDDGNVLIIRKARLDEWDSSGKRVREIVVQTTFEVDGSSNEIVEARSTVTCDDAVDGKRSSLAGFALALSRAMQSFVEAIKCSREFDVFHSQLPASPADGSGADVGEMAAVAVSGSQAGFFQNMVSRFRPAPTTRTVSVVVPETGRAIVTDGVVREFEKVTGDNRSQDQNPLKSYIRDVFRDRLHHPILVNGRSIFTESEEALKLAIVGLGKEQGRLRGVPLGDERLRPQEARLVQAALDLGSVEGFSARERFGISEALLSDPPPADYSEKMGELRDRLGQHVVEVIAAKFAANPEQADRIFFAMTQAFDNALVDSFFEPFNPGVDLSNTMSDIRFPDSLTVVEYNFVRNGESLMLYSNGRFRSRSLTTGEVAPDVRGDFTVTLDLTNGFECSSQFLTITSSIVPSQPELEQRAEPRPDPEEALQRSLAAAQDGIANWPQAAPAV